MSMRDYALTEQCALLVHGALAAAVNLHSWQQASEEDKAGACFEDPGVEAALRSGRSAWDVATDPAFHKELYGEDSDWASVSDALDSIQASGHDAGVTYCSEFDGTAVRSGGFESDPYDIRFDDDYICYLAPLKSGSLFEAAYPSRDALLDEYRERILEIAGPGVPVEKFVYDVDGTYVA